MSAPGWLALGRPLGSGGMGQVFEARDLRTGERVAVKTLRDFSSTELLCLKNEFRQFADVVHPNLVTQHELVEHEGQWFLLMEHLEGASLLQHVRRSSPPVEPVLAHATPRPGPDEQTQTTNVKLIALTADAEPLVGHANEQTKPSRGPTLAEVSAVLAQLAAGIDAIHRSGHLHRDLKPANVMVCSDGRVVVLDFGIAIALQRARAATGQHDVVVGTPAYMPPELVLGEASSPAADWYSFGVMLFEVFAGTRPFTGTPNDVFRRKLQVPAPRLSTHVADVPPQLDQLVAELLAKDPRQRPSFAQIASVLGAPELPAALPATMHALVGRTRELAALHEHAKQARARPRLVLVRGRSGVGKSTLLSQLVTELSREGALVLDGRCYEQEYVPYKTVDKLVDGLTRELHREPALAAAVAPADVGALEHAFPVLRGAFPSGGSPTPVSDAADLQRRALDALVGLLRGVATKRRLVCCVDDLQAGDTGSVSVLARLTRPGEPPVLVVCAFREEESSAAAVRALESALAHEGSLAEHLTIGPMEPGDLRALAAVLGREAGMTTPEVLTWAERECAGQPFLLHELLFWAAQRAPGAALPSEGQTLQHVIAARAASLPDQTRELLEVVALGGHALPGSVALRVAGAAHTARSYRQLRAAHFLRTTGRDESEQVDTYHDKIREVVTARLDPERTRTLHARLFDGWAAAPETTLGRGRAMATHARLAGELISTDRALEAHLAAAKESMAAFDSGSARALLQTARVLAGRLGQPFAPELELTLADACLATADVDGAKEALDNVLAVPTSSLLRARAWHGVARVKMGRLDAPGAFDACCRALAELSLPAVTGSVVGLLKALAKWVARYAVRAVFGHGRGAADQATTLGLALYTMSGYSAYFLMNRRMLVECLLLGYAPASRMTMSGRVAAEWYATAAGLPAIVGVAWLTNRLVKRARELAAAIADPAAPVAVEAVTSTSIDMMGHPVDAEPVAQRALAQGNLLEGAVFFNTVGSLAWNQLMRGRAREGWVTVQHGLRRLEAGNASLLGQGHTFRCYAAPLLCLLGRAEEGLGHLDAYAQLLATHAPGDVFRNLMVHAHRALFLQLSGASDDALERVFAAHDALGVKAGAHPHTVKHYYVAHAYRRVDQAVARPDDAQVRRRAQQSLETLRALGRHPTLVLHAEVLGLTLEALHGRPPLDALASLRVRAQAAQTPWVAAETLVAEVRWWRQQRDEARVETALRALDELVGDASLAPLAKRARAAA